MKRIELARPRAVSEAQAPELARLNIREGVRSRAAFYPAVPRVIRPVIGVRVAVNDGPLGRARITYLQVQNDTDLLGCLRPSRRALADQAGFFGNGLGV